VITPEERQHGPEEALPPPLYGLVLAGGEHPSEAAPDRQAFDILDEHCELAFLSSRKDQLDLAGHVEFPQIVDGFEDLGAMGGILSALRTCPEAAWLVVARNEPDLDLIRVGHLIVNRNPEQAITAYVNAGDGLPNPFCAIYEPRARDLLLACVNKGMTNLRRVLAQVGSQVELLAPPRSHIRNASETEA